MNESLTVGQLIDILSKENREAVIDFQINAFPALDKQPELYQTMGISKVMTSISPLSGVIDEPYHVLIRILTPAEHVYIDRCYVAHKKIPVGGPLR